jgi:uncharacterized protein (TIGR03435 family)
LATADNPVRLVGRERAIRDDSTIPWTQCWDCCSKLMAWNRGRFWARRCSLVGADFYEVTATMPPDTTKAQFQTMLQNLLAERFHLVAHHETRNFPAYELVVDKGGPKMKESAVQPDDGALPAGPRVIVIHAGVGTISLRGQTTEDLTARLETALLTAQMVQTQNVNLPRPRVVDKTGLTGKYTFDLEFSQPGPPGFTPAPGSPASDLPDLFTALRTRLGLRLDKTPGVPVDVVVVDSVDKVPVAN